MKALYRRPRLAERDGASLRNGLEDVEAGRGAAPEHRRAGLAELRRIGTGGFACHERNLILDRAQRKRIVVICEVRVRALRALLGFGRRLARAGLRLARPERSGQDGVMSFVSDPVINSPFAGPRGVTA